MTSPDPMSRDELLELAPLDAFALLEDYEAALFNRSFHHAPASVQAEIRELQATLAEHSAFQSREEPRPLLRQKVLVRLQEEIEEATEQLQPLAQIGNQLGNQLGNQSGTSSTTSTTVPGGVPIGSPVVGHPVIGSGLASTFGPSYGSGLDDAVGAGTSDTSSVHSMLSVAGAVDGRHGFGQDAAMRELVAEIRARAAAGVKDRATPYWRAAAFFLAASLVVSLYFLARTINTAEQVLHFAQQNAINAEIKDLVPEIGDFAYRESHICGLTCVDPTVNATASLFVDAKHSRVLLVAFGLSGSTGPFALRLVDDRGNARVIENFNSAERVTGVVASLPTDINLAVSKFEVLDVTGKVILRSA